MKTQPRAVILRRAQLPRQVNIVLFSRIPSSFYLQSIDVYGIKIITNTIFQPGNVMILDMQNNQLVAPGQPPILQTARILNGIRL